MTASVLFTAFVTVFLAELGDKTQLATLLLAGSSKQPWSVFLGAALALVLSAALGAALGSALSHVLSQRTLDLAGGLAFLGMGAWMLWRASH
ncbi:MAG: TMEM165/GDT1 family protein [Planctomycetes bacterium]|nr:TMEM165/GDT1 family protein [Planctomycetota bacterium]